MGGVVPTPIRRTLLNRRRRRRHGIPRRDHACLQEILAPALSDSKERTLVEAEYSPRPLLDRELESWRSDPDSPRALVLFGGPGSGKSSWVARQLHYNHSALCGVFLEWDKSSSSDVKSVIDLVAFKLAAKVSDYRSLLLHLLEHQIAGDRRSAASDAEYSDLLIAAPFGSRYQKR